MAGTISMLKLLARQLKGEPEPDSEPRSSILFTLRSCVEYNMLEVAQRLNMKFKFTKKEITEEYFLKCCTLGHKEFAQWFAEEFDLTPADARKNRNEALRQACSEGHLKTAKWLAAHFKLDKQDFVESRSDTLRTSGMHGHLDVVKWVASQMELDAEGVTELLQDSCILGHYCITKWILETFALTEKDIRVNHDINLVVVCQYGNLDHVKLIADRITTTENIMRAFRTACENGHLEVAQWLVKKFNSISQSFSSQNNSSHSSLLKTVIKNGHSNVSRWLTLEFGLHKTLLMGAHP